MKVFPFNILGCLYGCRGNALVPSHRMLYRNLSLLFSAYKARFVIDLCFIASAVNRSSHPPENIQNGTISGGVTAFVYSTCYKARINDESRVTQKTIV